jgi:hypothetical protein
LSKDLTARGRIVAYLAANGAVIDDGGRATAVLKDLVGYEGSPLAFIQLVASMERAGQIRRVVRGKRTYRIEVSTGETAASQQGGAHGTPLDAGQASATEVSVDSAFEPTQLERAGSKGTEAGEMDYDELAGALLSRVARVLGERASRPDSDRPILRRRLEQLSARNTELERQLARTRAAHDAVVVERDELRRQLEAASHNLSLLTERLGTPRRPASGAAARLDSDERALLYRLSRNADRRDEAS